MELEPIRVIKHVVNYPKDYDPQHFVVLNRYPNFRYERQGYLLLAEDCGFYSAFRYEAPSERWKAFAGREFDISMKDGSVEKAYGQWWHIDHPVYKQGNMVRRGFSTMEDLINCYVFSGGVWFDKKLLETCTDEPVLYWELEREYRAIKEKRRRALSEVLGGQAL